MAPTRVVAIYGLSGSPLRAYGEKETVSMAQQAHRIALFLGDPNGGTLLLEDKDYVAGFDNVPFSPPLSYPAYLDGLLEKAYDTGSNAQHPGVVCAEKVLGEHRSCATATISTARVA